MKFLLFWFFSFSVWGQVELKLLNETIVMMNKACDTLPTTVINDGVFMAEPVAACLHQEDRLLNQKFLNLLLSEYRLWVKEGKKESFKEQCLKFKEKWMSDLSKEVNEKIKRRCGGEQDLRKTCFSQDLLLCRLIEKKVIEMPKFMGEGITFKPVN